MAGPARLSAAIATSIELYALDTVLPDLKRRNKAALEKAMQGHILAQAVLIGTYQKRL
jgi:phosphatidylethanolamine-binding protein (PEBP) family uncharacterized protein